MEKIELSFDKDSFVSFIQQTLKRSTISLDEPLDSIALLTILITSQENFNIKFSPKDFQTLKSINDIYAKLLQIKNL